jgi:hypothetical protein
MKFRFAIPILSYLSAAPEKKDDKPTGVVEQFDCGQEDTNVAGDTALICIGLSEFRRKEQANGDINSIGTACDSLTFWISMSVQLLVKPFPFARPPKMDYSPLLLYTAQKFSRLSATSTAVQDLNQSARSVLKTACTMFLQLA